MVRGSMGTPTMALYPAAEGHTGHGRHSAMGLGLEVGILADLRDNDEEGYADMLEYFAAINAALQTAGLPPHHEPDDRGGTEPWYCSIGSYDTLHGLRRLAAHLWAGRGLPEPGSERAWGASIMQACYDRTFADSSPFRSEHLIFHSDYGGFYLPLRFHTVIEPAASLGIEGGTLGSSYMLREECQRIAAVLDLPLDQGLVWEGEAEWTPPQAANARSAVWQRYLPEARTCWLLSNACHVSISHRLRHRVHLRLCLV